MNARPVPVRAVARAHAPYLPQASTPINPTLTPLDNNIDNHDDAPLLDLRHDAVPGLNSALPTIPEKPHALALEMRVAVVPGGSRC